jgi:hypothetical protein
LPCLCFGLEGKATINDVLQDQTEFVELVHTYDHQYRYQYSLLVLRDKNGQVTDCIVADKQYTLNRGKYHFYFIEDGLLDCIPVTNFRHLIVNTKPTESYRFFDDTYSVGIGVSNHTGLRPRLTNDKNN